jgi:hypothetical protein
MGETPEECQQRYGQPVTNYPGHGDVVDVVVYLKDGISVSVFFVKVSSKDTCAGLVIYLRVRPDVPCSSFPPPEFTQDEQTSLLGTVTGRWDDHGYPPRLPGSLPKALPLSPAWSITARQRDTAAQTVQKVIGALYLPRQWPWVSTTVKDVAHNGPKLFAFRAARGLVLCSYDHIAALARWADYAISEREKAKHTPKGRLTGF